MRETQFARAREGILKFPLERIFGEPGASIAGQLICWCIPHLHSGRFARPVDCSWFFANESGGWVVWLPKNPNSPWGRILAASPVGIQDSDESALSAPQLYKARETGSTFRSCVYTVLGSISRRGVALKDSAVKGSTRATLNTRSKLHQPNVGAAIEFSRPSIVTSGLMWSSFPAGMPEVSRGHPVA